MVIPVGYVSDDVVKSLEGGNLRGEHQGKRPAGEI